MTEKKVKDAVEPAAPVAPPLTEDEKNEAARQSAKAKAAELRGGSAPL